MYTAAKSTIAAAGSSRAAHGRSACSTLSKGKARNNSHTVAITHPNLSHGSAIDSSWPAPAVGAEILTAAVRVTGVSGAGSEIGRASCRGRGQGGGRDGG